MAWVVTQQGVGDVHASALSWESGSFTPAANALLLLVCVRTNDESISGITGHDGGSAWIQLDEIVDTPEASSDIEVWGCFTGASPGSDTVEVSKTDYTWRFIVNLIEVSEDTNGVDVSGTVANACGTMVNDLEYNAALQITLPAFDDSDNLSFAWGYIGAGGITFGFEGTWTALAENDDIWTIHAGYFATEDNTVDLTIDAWLNAGLHGFEVKQAAAGGLSIPIAMHTHKQLMRRRHR